MRRPGYKLLSAWLSIVMVAAGASDDAVTATDEAAEARKAAAQPGAVELPSGLSYRVLAAGRGKKPSLSDEVSLNFRATTLDGREVDSSADGRPMRLRVGQTMPAWREVLPMMKEGARWVLQVPPGLGYTKSGGTRYTRSAGSLTREELVFELELVQVHPQRAASFASLSRRTVRRPSRAVPHVFVYLMEEEQPEAKSALQSPAETPLELTTETLAGPTAAPWRPKPGQGGGLAGQQTVGPPIPQAAEARNTGSIESSAEGANARSGQAPVPNGMPPIVLESGLRYRIVRNGGGLAPLPGDTISFKYRETASRPRAGAVPWHRAGQVTLPLEALGPAWRAVFRRMEEGAKWEVQAPPALVRGPWGVGGDELVKAEVELMAVSTAPVRGVALAALEPSAAAETLAGQTRQAPSGDSPLHDLAGGLRYRVLRSGTGERLRKDDWVTLRFRSRLLALDRGHSYFGEGEARLRVGDAEAAWQEVLRSMRGGARWELYLPSELMQGRWAPPAGHTAVIAVELRDIERAESARLQ